MQSTRARLARAIEGEAAVLRRGLAAWLGADGTTGLPPPELRRLCRRVVGDLRRWLEGREGTPAPAGPLGERPARLARSFLAEYFKSEGVLDGLPRGCRDEVHGLLDAFFDRSPTVKRPPTGHISPHRRNPCTEP